DKLSLGKSLAVALDVLSDDVPKISKGLLLFFGCADAKVGWINKAPTDANAIIAVMRYILLFIQTYNQYIVYIGSCYF
ncbi:MAG TPA: hypothetical protein VM682_02785, partial [Bacillus sp. (in: firmicutes)]|nr:hypothetical protein [Bacillus sp. (in: firmicutes)]